MNKDAVSKINIDDLLEEAGAREQDRKKYTIDPQIVAAMCRGDSDAFQKIYLHSVGPLTDFLKILLFSTPEAEDAAQDAFAYILGNLDKIDPGKNFKGYLYTIAKTMAFRQIERRKRNVKYADYRAITYEAFDISPDEIVMTKELSIILNTYFYNMPPQRKRVFKMSRNEGKSTKEIARELNISEDTVRMHLRLAVKGFKDIIIVFVLLFS